MKLPFAVVHYKSCVHIHVWADFLLVVGLVVEVGDFALHVRTECLDGVGDGVEADIAVDLRHGGGMAARCQDDDGLERSHSSGSQAGKVDVVE